MQHHLAAVVADSRGRVIGVARIYPDVASCGLEIGIARQNCEASRTGHTRRVIAQQDRGAVGIGGVSGIARSCPRENDISYIRPGFERQFRLINLGLVETGKPARVIRHRQRCVGAIGIGDVKGMGNDPAPSRATTHKAERGLIYCEAELTIGCRAGAAVGIEEPR